MSGSIRKGEEDLPGMMWRYEKDFSYLYEEQISLKTYYHMHVGWYNVGYRLDAF
jgi:hypothetical protein